MPAFKVEGIILKRRDFGEADKILTAFCLQQGKVSIVARGVRRINSRRAGNVELLNRVVMYLHQGKSLPVLTEATALETYQKLKEDLTLSTAAFHIIELIDRLTAQNQENRNVYLDLTEVLKRLSTKPRQVLIRAFEVKLLSNLGFWSTEEIKGVDKKILDLLNLLQYTKWEEIGHIQLNQNEAVELERILRYSIEKIIEGKLKSRLVLKKM